MKIFISYRRSDTQDLAGRIADRLNAVSGIEQVFIDVDGIEPGAEFENKIKAALAQSDACLILIGEAWRGERAAGEKPRVFDDNDFVRLEVATALAAELRILPVLANNTPMPSEAHLPADLRRLPKVLALSVRHEYFEHDMDYLINVLLGRATARNTGAFALRHPACARILRACMGAGLALAVLLLGAVLHGHFRNRSLEETLGGPGEVWMLIGATLVCGAVLALLAGRSRR